MPVRVTGRMMERAAMSTFDNPFDPQRRLNRSGCACGRHRNQAEHDYDAQRQLRAPTSPVQGECHQRVHARLPTRYAPALYSSSAGRSPASPALQCAQVENEEQRYEGVVASAVMRAVFPQDAVRRAFLKSVGASTALAALSQLFPLKTATEVFAQENAIEKKDLKVGFIPITCATPIIMAHPMGFYSKHGLNVEVIKTAGWAVIRDKTLNKEYDAAHMLSPMPLAITLGAGSNPIPYTMPAVENINGQAITLSIKHKERNDPKKWKGFKFAVPFDYSMHNYLLRYYVAEHGLDPDQDIQIRAVPPPEMVANLRADNIDGYLGPDPFNQRAVYDGVGFIHILSKELWEGHPCCAFAASKEFVTAMPNTYAALLRSIIDATAFAHKPENRKQIAAAIAPANYLNQPETVLEQVLTGTYADGLGNVKRDPNRIDFDPFPWQSFAIWILTQMKRWGQIKGDVDYAGVARQVFLATDTTRLMKEVGLTPPTTTSKTFVVMGKTFDPAKPEDYIKSFKIKRV
jgi:nitrate/nitrite transport system substrate-binding protein